MSALTLRNPRGDHSPVPEFSATEAKNSFGKVLDTAISQGMATITKRDRPAAVVLSMDAYQALLAGQVQPLQHLSQEFDALLLQMQAGSSRQGALDAFDASPQAMGQAALNAAQALR